jgi:hypothetical protein
MHQHAVPIDLRAVAATRSTVRLDLYMFLTYRLNSLRRPVRLPWSALLAQIGIQPPEGNAAALKRHRPPAAGCAMYCCCIPEQGSR